MLGYYFHTASWNLVIGKLHYCACKSKRGSMRGVGVKCQDLPFEISPLLNSQGTGPPPLLHSPRYTKLSLGLPGKYFWILSWKGISAHFTCMCIVFKTNHLDQKCLIINACVRQFKKIYNKKKNRQELHTVYCQIYV